MHRDRLFIAIMLQASSTCTCAVGEGSSHRPRQVLKLNLEPPQGGQAL